MRNFPAAAGEQPDTDGMQQNSAGSFAQRGELGGWRHRTTFVLALAAAAVALGNLWRFAYLLGEQGGGAFMLTYIACLFLLAGPVLIAELVIGTHGRGAPVAALRCAADRSLLSRGWMAIGLGACITGFLVVSYCVVVAGWSLTYAWSMQAGTFNAASVELVAERLRQLLGNPGELIYWQTLFLTLLVAILLPGIRGPGAFAWLAVPLLIVLLGTLVKFALDTGDMAATRDFLFSVKLADFSARSVLLAMGHAFFTLGVGTGVGIMYGAYAPERIPVGRSVAAVALFDTVIGLMAGLAIFPVLFAANVAPAAGPGLMFIAVPYAFGNSVQGEWFGMLFFVLVAVASLGSAVAIMETLVGALRQWLRLGRFTALLLLALAVWLLSLAVALSFGPTGEGVLLGGGNLFRWLDTVTAGFLLPGVALFTALLVGWRLRPELLREALSRESAPFFSLWWFSVRYITPLAVLVLLFAALGEPP